MIGERIGPYRVVELLGEGGLAEVYRAYNQETSEDVAIKVLRKVPDERTRTRFAREAEALQDLDHPNIIRILASGVVDQRPYYTMPFVRVRSLQELIRERFDTDGGRFSQDEILRVVVDVARALRYAHSRGIVHRDVKPGNILIDENFRPVLCDFGLARHGGQETVTRQGSMLGTPRYMSPEQLQGKRSDARADLYALGLIAYEMAAGDVPFAGGEPLAAAVRRLTGTIPELAPLAPQLAPEVSAAVMACVAKDPALRPAQVGSFLARVEGLPGAPPPVSPADSGQATVEEPAAPDPGPAPDPAEEPVGPKLALAGGAALLAAATFALPALLIGEGVTAVAGRLRLTPAADAATLELSTEVPVRLGVRYGPPGRLGGYVDSPAGAAMDHTVVLGSLNPDTAYEFALVITAKGATKEDRPRPFRTARGDE